MGERLVLGLKFESLSLSLVQPAVFLIGMTITKLVTNWSYVEIGIFIFHKLKHNRFKNYR